MTLNRKVITQVDQVLAITYVYGASMYQNGVSFYENPCQVCTDQD